MKKLAQVLDRILKVMYWIMFVTIPVTILMSVAFSTLLNEIDQPILFKLDTNYQYKALNFIMTTDLTNELIVSNVGSLWVVVTFIVLMFNITQIRGILEGVLEDKPFSSNIVCCIKKLAYGIIFGSLIISSLTSITDFLSFQSLNIFESLNQIGVEVNFWWSIIEDSLILEGLLILLLAHVFQYGLHLQEEYDETL